MSWTEEKVEKLKELWGKGNTASQIAEILGGVSRNAVIGKAHRLNLSAKIKTRQSTTNNESFNFNKSRKNKRFKKSRFQSLLLNNDFEPAKNLSLEELTENTCKYMEGHPDEAGSSFVVEKMLKNFLIVLCIMMIYQPKGKKKIL